MSHNQTHCIQIELINFYLEIAKIGEGKKIFQLEYISEEHLLVVVSGKQRYVRLVPIRALDGDDTEWIKVAESKGCSVLAVGQVLQNPSTFCLCVAVKKQVSFLIILIFQKVSFVISPNIIAKHIDNNNLSNNTNEIAPSKT